MTAKSWDEFDQMVLWTVAQRNAATFDDVAALLPDGVSYHLIRAALDHAVNTGLIRRRREADGGTVVTLGATRAMYDTTEAGRARLAAADSRKAA